MRKPKLIRVYFDTEFTKFRSERDEPKLISIGCVAAGGQEFYAELTDTYQPSDCTDFVLKTVLPLLGNADAANGRHEDARMFESKLAYRLSEWVQGFGGEVEFVCDSPAYDWRFVEYLFTFYGWPANLKRNCGTIFFNSPNIQHRYDAAVYEYWKANAHLQHHALVDAQCMLFAVQQARSRCYE